MGLSVVSGSAGHRIEGVGGDVDVVNAFLDHLSVQNFPAATRRVYAFHLLNFCGSPRRGRCGWRRLRRRIWLINWTGSVSPS